MNNIKTNPDKIIIDLVKQLADPTRFQVSMQYPGQSLEREWGRAELIVSYTPSQNIENYIQIVTVFVFCQNINDLKIVKKIKESNTSFDIRIVALIDAGEQYPSTEDVLKYWRENNILTLSFNRNFRDAADLILKVSSLEEFNFSNIKSILIKRLKSLGYNSFSSKNTSNVFSLDGLRVVEKSEIDYETFFVRFLVLSTGVDNNIDYTYDYNLRNESAWISIEIRRNSFDYILVKETRKDFIEDDIEHARNILASYSFPLSYLPKNREPA